MICQTFSKCLLIDMRRVYPKITKLKVLKLCFIESRVLAVVLFRIGQYLWSKKFIWRLAPIIKRLNEILTGFECHLDSTIGEGLLIAHTQNIVIAQGAIIGKNVTIYNGVTLGAVSKDKGESDFRFPRIKDGAIIYIGAKILGPVTIGRMAIIGANAVVLQDVPDGCVAVGVPAHILEHKGGL